LPGVVGEQPTLPAGVTDWRRLTNEDWQKRLTRAQFLVTRMKATEPAWSGQYMRGKPKGLFACVCCGTELFSSNHKYVSGTGWPSFWRPLVPGRLETAPDYSNPFERRTEVSCSTCGAHLGHVFQDGPPPTGLRFCINSVSLRLVKPGAARKATEGQEGAFPIEGGAAAGSSAGRVGEPGDELSTSSTNQGSAETKKSAGSP
jgi:peptide-methionine (R)-S-oxide reductase